MNLIMKKSFEAAIKEYVSPEVKVVMIHPEGVLCSSNEANHESFNDGGSYDI